MSARQTGKPEKKPNVIILRCLMIRRIRRKATKVKAGNAKLNKILIPYPLSGPADLPSVRKICSSKIQGKIAIKYKNKPIAMSMFLSDLDA